MQWFKHDTDASTDAKIRKLVMRHGPVGYAVYFHCLELIMADVNESNITFELEHDAEIIADNLKIQGDGLNAGVDIVNKIMHTIIDLNLFQSSCDRIFCLKLASRLDSSMTSNSRFRKKIGEVKKSIENGQPLLSHDGVMMGSCSSHDSVMQEENKNRTEEIRIEEKEKKQEKKENLFSSFEPYIPPKQKQTGDKLREVWDHWNTMNKENGGNLPKDPYTGGLNGKGRDMLDILNAHGIERVKECIGKLNRLYPSISHRPSTPAALLLNNSITHWLNVEEEKKALYDTLDQTGKSNYMKFLNANKREPESLDEIMEFAEMLSREARQEQDRGMEAIR